RLGDAGVELAFHFEQSGDPDRAVPCFEEAAARAVRRGAAREAVELLNRGLGLLEALPVTPARTLLRIRGLLALGLALSQLRGPGDRAVEQACLRARALSEQSNDPVQLIQALAQLAPIYVVQARLERAAETAEAMRRLMPVLPFPGLVAVGNQVLGI